MTLIRFNITPPIRLQATQTGIAQGPRGYSTYELYLQNTDDDPVLSEGEWLLSLVGPQGLQGIQGVPGTEIELQLSDTHVQWRYVGGTWADLVAIADITGPQGPQGIQGPQGTEIELQHTATHIQWRYIGGSWADLVAIADITGPQGPQGQQGIQGPQGTEIELQLTATHVQWRYVGGSWTNLVAIADITGPQGIQGIQGIQGTEVELQNTGTYIQWRYQGGAWSNLVSLADITGPRGNSGSSYTLDFQTAVTVMSDINMEGAITITDIAGLNVATLKLNNVSQALGSGLSIAATANQVLTWEITRTTTGMAALGIKFTRN